MTTNPVYRDYPNEMAIVGRLLVNYSDLEIGLMHCVSMVRADLDSTLKAMFRVRGETMRINIADALAHQEYLKLGLQDQFAQAIAATRFCLRIRNKFTHSYWHNPLDGLCYVSLEDLADTDEVVANLTGLDFFYLDLGLLERHQAYFRYTDALLAFVNLEGQRLAGKAAAHTLRLPARLEPPPLYIRKVVHAAP